MPVPDQGLEDSELSYCTLEDLCQPSEDDKRPHVITSRNGKSMYAEQEQIDQAAAGNTANYSTLLKSAHKFINGNCFDGTAAFEPQFESFLSAFLCHRVTTVGKTLSAGYCGYTAHPLMELSLNTSKHLLITRAQYADITHAITARHLSKSRRLCQEEEHLQRDLAPLRKDRQHDSPQNITCLELKLQDLRNL